MLTVSEETSFGIPPLICAWRLGIWPCPAWSTWPKTTCSTCSGDTSARSSAAAMAVPPRSVASSEANAPPIFPNGVRAAPRITVFGMSQNAIDWVRRSYARRGRSRDGRCRDASASGDGERSGVDTTCSFALTRLDATTTNALALDTNAVYWGGTYAALPGTRIRIEGQYPHARYISWNVLRRGGAADRRALRRPARPRPGQLEPVPARRRPYRRTNRSYTAFIEVGPKPAQPAPKLCSRTRRSRRRSSTCRPRAAEQDTMGDYYPQSEYLASPADFKAPAAVVVADPTS